MIINSTPKTRCRTAHKKQQRFGIRIISILSRSLVGVVTCLASYQVLATSIKYDPDYKMATLGGMVGEVEFGERDGKRTALVTLEGKNWHELIEFTIKDSFDLKPGSAVRILHVKDNTLGATLTGCMVKVLAEPTYNTAGELEFKQPEKAKYIDTEQVGDCHFSLEEALAANANRTATKTPTPPDREMLMSQAFGDALVDWTFQFKELINACEHHFPPTVPALKKRIENWQQKNEKLVVEVLAEIREQVKNNKEQAESVERLIYLTNNMFHYSRYPDGLYAHCVEAPEDINEGLKTFLKKN